MDKLSRRQALMGSLMLLPVAQSSSLTLKLSDLPKQMWGVKYALDGTITLTGSKGQSATVTVDEIIAALKDGR